MNSVSTSTQEQLPSVENILHSLDDSVQTLATKDFHSVTEKLLNSIAHEIETHPMEMAKTGFSLGAGLSALKGNHLSSAASYMLKLVTWKALSSSEFGKNHEGTTHNATQSNTHGT